MEKCFEKNIYVGASFREGLERVLNKPMKISTAELLANYSDTILIKTG